MADWRSILDQLEISDGAVAGLSAADKPIIAGKLLQIPAEDRALFFRGQHSDVLRRLRTLLPDVASGKATLKLIRVCPCTTTALQPDLLLVTDTVNCYLIGLTA